MARRDEGAYPPAVCDRGATKLDGLFPENPPGGGSFARGRRWLVPYSPLRGCSELAALATAKIPRRRPSANFKTGSWLPDVSGPEARRALQRLGFVFKRQRGSHVILRRGNRGCVVPMHREISRGTLRGVLEQAGV